MRTRPMQPVGLLFPDAASLTASYLQSMMPPGFRIATDLTDWHRPMEAIHVFYRSGENQGVVERARLQVDVRCNTQDRTYDVTNVMRSFLLELPLHHPEVVRVEEWTGPQAVPDADQKPRLMTVFDVFCKGARRPPSV